MKILHVGATGLVGQLVLARLLESPGVARVVAPTRRPLALRHPALETPVVAFDALPADAPWWAVDDAICTLGTTPAVAGSRDRSEERRVGQECGRTVRYRWEHDNTKKNKTLYF